MLDTVFLRFIRGGSAPQVCEWITTSDHGLGETMRGSLEEASAVCAGMRTIFLAPAEDMLITTVDVPARNRQRLLQALPYALEERLAQDVEDMHLVPGTRRSDGIVPVVAVDRVRFERWLTILREYDIEPERMIPDLLATPYAPGSWTLLDDEGMVLLRTDAQEGLAIDPDNLAVVLASVLEEAVEVHPTQLRVYAPEEYMADFNGLATLGLEILPEPLPGPPIEALAAHAESAAAIDLLLGKYSRRERLGKLYRRWLPAAVMLGTLLVLNFSVLLYDYLRLSHEETQLRTSIENTYREAFPEAQRIVDPRAQMQRGLEALRHGGGESGGFMDMLRGVAPLLSQTPGLQVQRISYQEGRLDLALVAPDLQNLDALVGRVSSEAGMRAEIQSASNVQDHIEARLQVRAAP
ncbi:MAG: type II secretion system protein GspL [Chromatiales bacterium]|jgi:general secretion pathway protein L|nr:type II secretion system protein GspL [Chromatiales bacterium]